jgi:inhibitor of the pro-sigma K processing machinery
MSNLLLAAVLIIVILAIAYYFVKKFAVLVVNAILGLILLFCLNYLSVMQWIGQSDLGYSIPTIIVCAVGGLPGVLILILLKIFGISI